MTTAIAEYSHTEAKLAELKLSYGATKWIITTTESMAIAKKARAEIRKWRVDIEAERKKIKAPALERCQAIDAEAKRITSELLALETPVDEAIKLVEAQKEAERQARAQAEQVRIEKARADIDDMREPARVLVGAASGLVEAAIRHLVSLDVTRTDEFADQAQAAKIETLTKLRELLAGSVAREAEQARIVAERAELAKQRAEQERQAREKAAEQAKIEAAARAKIEAEEQAARERIAEQERQARVAREAADSEARALRAKADEEARRARAAMEAEVAAADARKRAEQAVRDEHAREVQRVEVEKGDARFMLTTFRVRYKSHPEFAGVIAAINEYFSIQEKQAA